MNKSALLISKFWDKYVTPLTTKTESKTSYEKDDSNPVLKHEANTTTRGDNNNRTTIVAPPTDMSKQEIEYTQEDDNIQILDIETSAPIS